MLDIIEGLPALTDRRPLARRLAWFAGLWLAGVAATAALAYATRWLLGL